MPKTIAPTVADELETFRVLVVDSRSKPAVGPAAEECAGRLNEMFQQEPGKFTAEDKRWANVLRGFLGQRLAAHAPKVTHTKKAKRKGDKLEHCWRCETPVDERFEEICPDCDTKAYHWRVCPVCKACGCQREDKKLI